ncbi:MAG: hypothetical protein ACJ76D_12160 [Solirubrobacterales bacterium]
MRWVCERGCRAGEEEVYPRAAEAGRFARAFDYDERDSTGKRAPSSACCRCGTGGR